MFVGKFEIHSWDERVKKAKFGDYADYQFLRESLIYKRIDAQLRGSRHSD